MPSKRKLLVVVEKGHLVFGYELRRVILEQVKLIDQRQLRRRYHALSHQLVKIEAIGWNRLIRALINHVFE